MLKIKVRKIKYIYVLLYLTFILFGIPWYWDASTKYIFLGLPIWVIISILCAILTSCLTCFILLQNSKNNE